MHMGKLSRLIREKPDILLFLSLFQQRHGRLRLRLKYS
jgi:hypothetical protein